MPLSRTPEVITAAVERHANLTSTLRDRMDDDFALYTLEEYQTEEGYASFTANEPQTFADKIMSWLSGAELVLRIPQHGDDRHEREVDTLKEKFFLGILNAADERLAKMMQPSLRDLLAWYITIRGWYFGRALLVKEGDDDRASVDITPWDPRHVYWQMGRGGMAWACHKTVKSKDEIEADYDLEIGTDEIAEEDREKRGFEVYDFYDDEINMVFMRDRVLKKPTPHGSPRIPVFYGFVGNTPIVVSERTDDTIKFAGESIFKSNRSIYDNNNEIWSILLELVSRSRKPPIVVTSPDGTKTLVEDPWKEGSEISLAEGDKIETLDLMQSAPDTAAFLGGIAGMIQRGALPHSVYGDIQFQLSGFAINTLRQGVDTQAQPRFDGLEAAYLQIFWLIAEQYSTSAYDPMQLSGRDRMRKYFSEIIIPETVETGCDPTVEFVGRLPEDDTAKMAAAQMAREGQVPLLSDRYIRDKVLGLQDADDIHEQVWEQVAERATPEANLYMSMLAAAEQGNEELAQIYFGQLTELYQQKLLAMALAQQQALAPPQATNGAQPNGANPGGVTASPQVLPNAMLGKPPPTPTPQSGPLVPPGQPRPGAFTVEERLRRAGLVGPSDGGLL